MFENASPARLSSAQHPGPGPSLPDSLRAVGALACAALRTHRGPKTHSHGRHEAGVSTQQLGCP